jgi:DNA primase large subunit
MNELLFAQMFPFSENARSFLKEKNISPENVSESSVKRAAFMILRANSGQDYVFDGMNASEEMLETEIIAFPTAKLILSLMRTQNIREKFSLLIKKKTFETLVKNSSPKDLCFSLADDFSLKYIIPDEKSFDVAISLLDYLSIYFVDEESKLINKNVSGGKVFLTVNDFARFLSELAYKKVFESLPIDKKHIPKVFEDYARSIDPQLATIEKKNFDLKIVGKIDPELFPPCMKVLYADQTAGKKLSYMARLALASFLFQLGMQKGELLSLFAKSPDFKKHIAEYHIERIFSKKLSSPGCKKLADYGLRVKECEKECRSTHPMRYYLSKMRIKNRMKNMPNENYAREKDSRDKEVN